MISKEIAGKSIGQWFSTHPLLCRMERREEVFWFNPGTKPAGRVLPLLDIGTSDIEDAAGRLSRFAPFIAKAFPETEQSEGIIESPLQPIPGLHDALSKRYNLELPGRLMLKCDGHLPISGSIKARGGIHEVLKHAEFLALKEGLLSLRDNYACLAEKRFVDFFGQYAIAVGSTGNLGLSIGIMGASLGFNVTVHMSADAKVWKKALLRTKGVTVIEYEGDYSEAVAKGRQEAEADPGCHFVDDENSKDLFMGYAVAAQRLKHQLESLEIDVDQEHPLFVYLPCGVGGAPGGITFGLKHVFGDSVHCLFVEPTHSPAMLMGIYTGLHDRVSVQDFGLDNKTDADGLAVGRPSRFVGKRMKPLIDGIYTVSDDTLFRQLALVADHEDIFMEPSAVAGIPGIVRVADHPDYLQHIGAAETIRQSTHIVWGTGGAMVPKAEMDTYYMKGKRLLDIE